MRVLFLLLATVGLSGCVAYYPYAYPYAYPAVAGAGPGVVDQPEYHYPPSYGWSAGGAVYGSAFGPSYGPTYGPAYGPGWGWPGAVAAPVIVQPGWPYGQARPHGPPRPPDARARWGARDRDGDGIPNRIDRDRDGNGVPDHPQRHQRAPDARMGARPPGPRPAPAAVAVPPAHRAAPATSAAPAAGARFADRTPRDSQRAP